MPNRIHRLLVLGGAGLLLLTSAGNAAKPAVPPSVGRFEQSFDAVLGQHKIVGAAFGFEHAGDPATEFYFGDARRDSHHKVDARTAYNWASITKTMTAIAILQLRDRGLLSLDDPAVRYVPELRQVHDTFGPVDAITIRELLNHSAGFRNPTWPWDCDATPNCAWQPFEPTRWSQVEAMLPFTNVAFRPGSRWSYSNVGYVFLGQIIERLTGDDYEVYITKNILMPLGMTSSYFDKAPYFLEPDVSASYLRAGDKITPQPLNFDSGITVSNSGLKAPISDMLKYERFLIGDPHQDVYDSVLKRSSLQEAWTGTLPTAEPSQPATAYTGGPGGSVPMMGLGFFVLNVNGHRYVYHDGDQGGFTAELMLDPDRHSASILMSNTTDTGAPTDTTHAESNTEPDPKTDLRMTLRDVLIQSVFPNVP
ncbi:MAG TPA: serine hydrolase domain-containing protein [Rhizomicrobium sp.]|nr:serine hydrolase domain-containing protein [Rhizomicrobium sp.]